VRLPRKAFTCRERRSPIELGPTHEGIGTVYRSTISNRVTAFANYSWRTIRGFSTTRIRSRRTSCDRRPKFNVGIATAMTAGSALTINYTDKAFWR
jgi:hypothetical protein